MPASQEWLGIYSAALLELTKAYNYFQVEPTDLTPEATAALAYEQYLTWLASAGCAGGGCELPGWDGPTFRRGPNFRIQQLSADRTTWETPTGDYAPPVIPERPEATEPEQQCGAASNAVHAIKQVFDTMVTWYQEEYDPALETIEWGTALAGSISVTLGLWTAGLAAFLQAALSAFHSACDLMFTSDWDEEFTEILTCTFKDNLTIEGGVAHFNYQQILWDLCGFILPVVDQYTRVRWQVWYILQIIGQDGLDQAGGLQNVEGDCVTCDTWCFEWTSANGLLTAGGWTLLEGSAQQDGSFKWLYYATPFDGAYRRIRLQRTIDTTQCAITGIGIRYFSPAGGGDKYFYLNVSNSTGLTITPYLYANTNTGIDYVPFNTGWNLGDTTTGEESLIDLRLNSNHNADWRLHAIKLTGTGVNPFGVGSNC